MPKLPPPPPSSSLPMISGRRRQRSSVTTATTTATDPIVINNLKYHPDRFYLNKPTTITSSSSSNPLFLDLPHLTSSLDLSCAIVGTYVIDPSYVTEAMPSLFGTDASVPVFVTHGTKRLNERMEETTTTETMTKNDPSRSSSSRRDATMGDKTTPTNDETTPPSSSTMDGAKDKPPPPTPDDEWLTTNDPHHPFQKRLCRLGPNVILSQIDPVQLIRPTAAAMTVGGSPTSSGREKKNHPNMTTTTTTMRNNRGCRRDTLDVIVIDDDDDEKEDKNETNDKEEEEVKRCDVERKWCRGVHHPKYLLLFEKDKSLIVIITTSNLTRPSSMDASWIQRFRPVATTDYNDDHDHSLFVKNDFGIVLSDFLLKSSEAAKAGHPSPWDFLKRHLGVMGREDFERRWRFDEAGVYLVSTVPGDHRTAPPPSRQRRTTTTTTSTTARRQESKTSISYGPERVSSILQSLQQSQKQPSPPPSVSSNKKRKSLSSFFSKRKGLARFPTPNPPAHPSWLLSNRRDRLVMQHTSWGGNWTRGEMERLIRIYMTDDESRGCSSGNNQNDDDDDDDDDCNGVLDRTTIIWPSRDFINDCHAHITNNDNNVTNNGDDNSGSGSGSVVISTPDNIPYALLSSKTFNSIDLAVLSRMALYDALSPLSDVILPPISPHVKSYGRILADGNNDNDDDENNEGRVCDCHLLAWFMITSACLSRGAQGHRTIITTTNCKKGDNNGGGIGAAGTTEDDEMMTTTFGNFELGVLFVSRFDSPGQERMYTSLCPRGRECRRRRRRSPIDECGEHHDDDDDDGSVFVTVNDSNDDKKANKTNGRTTTRTTSQHCRVVRATPLPIPYDLRSSLYQSDPDDADFDYDPFMHDVEDGSETVGLMALTPRGRRESVGEM